MVDHFAQYGPVIRHPVPCKGNLLETVSYTHLDVYKRQVLRAKIDMAHPNMLFRDPIMYRMNQS